MRFLIALVLAPLLPAAIYALWFSGSALLAAIWLPQILLWVEAALLLLIALPDRLMRFHRKVALAGAVTIGGFAGVTFCTPFLIAFAQPECVGVYVNSDFVGCLSNPIWVAMAKAIGAPVLFGVTGGVMYWVLAKMLGVYPKAPSP